MSFLHPETFVGPRFVSKLVLTEKLIFGTYVAFWIFVNFWVQGFGGLFLDRERQKTKIETKENNKRMNKCKTWSKQAKSLLCFIWQTKDSTKNSPTSKKQEAKNTTKKARSRNKIDKDVLNKHYAQKHRNCRENSVCVHKQKPKQQTQPNPQSQSKTRETKQTEPRKEQKKRNKEGLGSRVAPPHLTQNLPQQKTEKKTKRGKGPPHPKPSKPDRAKINKIDPKCRKDIILSTFTTLPDPQQQNHKPSKLEKNTTAH